MLQPVIGAIMFVVVTQGTQGGRQSLPQHAPEPISALRWSAALPHFCAGRCACWLLPGIRHTHARAHAHGLALIHRVSTKDTASLGLGLRDGVKQLEGEGACRSS